MYIPVRGRLTKIKRGYYRSFGRICVPGFNWSGMILTALGEIPSVCQMSWWTTRGKYRELASNIIYRMLKKIHLHMGRVALHVFDRGYACSEMLEYLFNFQQDFLIRWIKNHCLINEKNIKKKIYLLARSYRGRTHKRVWDKERKQFKNISIAWAPVKHPDFRNQSLFLLILRDKKNHQSPMYLLTSVKIINKKQAWKIVFSYFHRWDIEQAFRFNKTELAIESPRIWLWENKLKLLAIVTLVFDFLLKLLRNWSGWVRLLFRNWCHRTGNRYRSISVPISCSMAIANYLLAFFFQL